MRREVRFVPSSGAVQIVERAARPALVRASRAIEVALPTFVPVHHGVMQDSYRPATEDPGSSDEVRMHVGSPFWHWMEYGTATNAPYRPVERAVRSLDLRYVPR